MEIYKNDILVEVRKNNFSGLYSIRIKNYANCYSMECKWNVIKKWLKSKNIETPNIKDIKFFSDGFNYSYGWFDGYGKVIGNLAV